MGHVGNFVEFVGVKTPSGLERGGTALRSELSCLLTKTERRPDHWLIGAARHLLIAHRVGRLGAAHFMHLNIIAVVRACAANEGKGAGNENEQADDSEFIFHVYSV